MIRVVLVDDHALIRRGLRETLSEAGGIDVVGEAADYSELRELLRTTQFDVLVIDVNLPGRSGIEVIGSLIAEGREVRALVLSQYPEDQYGVRALKTGAMGYLNKASDPAQIVAAVRSVGSGRKFLTPEIAQALAETIAGRSDGPLHEKLSEREMQTLVRIANGQKLSEIAEALVLSPKTVSVYRARVLEKLGLHTSADLAAYAVRHRLID